MAGLLGAVILRKGLERIGAWDTASPLVAGEGSGPRVHGKAGVGEETEKR